MWPGFSPPRPPRTPFAEGRRKPRRLHDRKPHLGASASASSPSPLPYLRRGRCSARPYRWLRTRPPSFPAFAPADPPQLSAPPPHPAPLTSGHESCHWWTSGRGTDQDSGAVRDGREGQTCSGPWPHRAQHLSPNSGTVNWSCGSTDPANLPCRHARLTR